MKNGTNDNPRFKVTKIEVGKMTIAAFLEHKKVHGTSQKESVFRGRKTESRSQRTKREVRNEKLRRIERGTRE
jgi:hypothetical protein